MILTILIGLMCIASIEALRTLRIKRGICFEEEYLVEDINELRSSFQKRAYSKKKI